MAAGLSAAGFPAGYVSARLAQSERSGAIAQFRAFSLRLLVCTDLLARGVDFGRVSLVIHLDAPCELPTYLHRVGRTGRYGTLGASVLLLSKRQWAEFAPIAAALRHRLQPLPADLREDDYLQQRAFSADEALQLEQLHELRAEAREAPPTAMANGFGRGPLAESGTARRRGEAVQASAPQQAELEAARERGKRRALERARERVAMT